MDSPQEQNLELAWKRYKQDLQDMAFCDNPFEVEIMDHNLPEWIKSLENNLISYSPSRSDIVNIPKKGFHLRPGTILSPEDATVFQALLLSEIHKIRQSLLWSAQKQRFSYILKADQSGTDWFVKEYKGWTNFREKSLSYIEQGYNFVVFADISAFFENISISRLISDLNALGVSDNIRSTLSKCLNRWAEPRQRGIPQGYRCSFILAEVYLNTIDKRLKNNGFKFCRYVDDIRIFCKSNNDAISALHFLTILLREKELNLQTAKSFIKSGDKARNRIDTITHIIKDVQNNLKKELSDIFDHEMTYTTPFYIKQGLEEIDQEEIELAAIRKAIDENIEKKGVSFDKTIFHYCINRLGAAGDNYAVDFCLEFILERPEEFIHMLSYFSKLSAEKIDIAERIIPILRADKNVFKWLHFLLLRWIYIQSTSSDLILEYCRYLAFNASADVYTRHYAWAILGINGDLADLDAIEAEYSRVDRDISKATIICSIKKMVTDRRNAIYSRAINDGKLIKYAIVWSKQS